MMVKLVDLVSNGMLLYSTHQSECVLGLNSYASTHSRVDGVTLGSLLIVHTYGLCL